MQETVILCGKQKSVNIPNNLPELLAQKQKLLCQKALAKKIIIKSKFNSDKYNNISLEIDSINSELKAINIEINKFYSCNSRKKRSVNRRKFHSEQRLIPFPTEKDWECKYNWVRSHLAEAMNLLFSSGDISPEDLEKKRKHLKDNIYTLTQWEKEQDDEYIEALKIIGLYSENHTK